MKHRTQALRFIGSSTSTTSISLANLLIIRPIGVISKNDIGLLKTLSNIRMCIVLDALMVFLAINIDAKSMKKAEKFH